MAPAIREKGALVEPGLPLEAFVRRGARDMGEDLAGLVDAKG
jgi:hypothetical protein